MAVALASPCRIKRNHRRRWRAASGRQDYNYFRNYEAATGRYMESDPVGLFGGINSYEYGVSTPLMSKDEKGLFVPAAVAEALFWTAVGRCLAGTAASFTTSVLKQAAKCCRADCGSWNIEKCDFKKCLKDSVNCEAKNAAIAGCIVGLLKPEMSFVAGWFSNLYTGLLWPCR